MPIDSTIENLPCAPQSATAGKRIHLNATGNAGDASLKKILFADASALVSHTERQGDDLLVNGSVTFSAVFAESNDTTGRVCVTGNFSEKLASPASGEITVLAETDGIVCRITGQKELALSCDVLLTAKGASQPAEPYIVSVSGDDFVTKQGKTEVLKRIAAPALTFSTEYTYEADAAVTPLQILYSHAFSRVSQTAFEGDRLLIEGEVSLFTLYSTEDEYDPCVPSTAVFPFSASLPVPLCDRERLATVSVQPADEPAVRLDTDADGRQRVLAVSLPLRVQAEVYEKQSVSYVEDCYSVCSRTEAKEASPLCLTGLLQKEYPFSFTVTCIPDESKGEIGKICSSLISPYEITCERDGGNLAVSGTVQTDQVYITLGDGGISSFSTEEAFRFAVPDEFGNTVPEADLFIRSVGFRAPDTSSVSVCVTGQVTLRSSVLTPVSVLSELKEGDPLPEESAAIRICPRRSGEELWSTAKRMHVRPEELCPDENSGHILVYRQILR